MFLGAKGCTANNTPENIAALPELKPLAEKFEIEETDYNIILTTYDSITFKEAINILKNKTEMNIPISFYGRDWGVYNSKMSAYEGIEPYRGKIYLWDGWWRAIEYDAVLAVNSGNPDEPVLLTEYAYCNETVYEQNQFSPYNDFFYYVYSLLDFEERELRKIQGDGSIDETIIMEFDK